jgi:hypothetical protein
MAGKGAFGGRATNVVKGAPSCPGYRRQRAVPLLALAAATGLVAATSAAQIVPRDGASSSRPNVLGGFDTEFADGERATSRPNVFGGETIETPEGRIESRPNVFGGRTYELPDGRRVDSQPNVFGGEDVEHDGRRFTCRPNVLGGMDCR